MICPNCKATDHESGAKYCHRCGYPLANNNGSSRECPKPQNHYNLSTDSVGLEAVDLGLPSGTRWANMNVGATKPEEFGDYYAWGEIETKEEYTWNNYIHGVYPHCSDIGLDISGTQYDVAHLKWGGKWRMPTYEQCLELINHCGYFHITSNDVFGLMLKGPSRNSIFLPIPGYFINSSVDERNFVAYYWAGSTYNYGVNGVSTIYFSCIGHPQLTTCQRFRGCSVRPVMIP